MKINKVIGGTLLVAGTTIGVGMLGLPVTTGFMGFFPSILLFLLCWSFMLATGIFFVDVNSSMKGEVNIISMAEKTLGPWGRGLAWVIYLLLLYSLMAAYIAAGAPLFSAFFSSLFHAPLSPFIAKFLLPLLFGGLIYLGTTGVDWINRLLMIGLVISYLLLIGFIPPKIEATLLTHVSFTPFFYAAPVVLTSFGYHIIIPTLATYVDHDRKSLLSIVVGGSVIALIVNILWEFLVLGTVPLSGSPSLGEAWVEGTPATVPLASIVKSPLILSGAYFFSFFAILTSFLGVSLSLSDFLTDGLKIKKTWEGRLLAIALTFIPPLIFVHTYQRGFLLALQYAGAFVAILLIFLPSAMAWTLKKPHLYQTKGGRLLLLGAMLFSFLMVVINILIQYGVFDGILEKML